MHFGPFHTHHHSTVDLGDTPPLVVFNERQILPDRKNVSLRWLTGSVLTGITSLVLMGGALFAALDGQYSVTAAPNPDQYAGNAQFAPPSGGPASRATV